VAEALIRRGYGLIPTETEQFTDERNGVKARKETPTLLSVQAGSQERLGLCHGSLPHESRRTGTDQAKFKASPQGGELFAF